MTIYMIEILCKDTDNSIYNDNYRVGYKTYEKAKEMLNNLIREEYDSLKSENINCSIVDYIEDDKEMYEREIYIEEDYEYLLTRYTIVKVSVE